MPEGHTLHRLARHHRKRFAGHAIAVSSPQGRFAVGAEQISGQVMVDTEAWGKHLLHRYESGLTVHVHLGLYGKFTDITGPPGEPVGQVRMRMVAHTDKGATHSCDLRGPTRCEVLEEPAVHALIARLGPDPLRNDADPDLALERIQRSTRPIAALLLDQSVLAGVGNVYRAEVLFRHNISPYRAGRDVTTSEWANMWDDLVDLMRIGVRRGKIIVIRPEDDHGPSGYGRGRPRTYVYRRTGDPCRLCSTPVAHADLGGRNLFWCPSCQSD